ncbi:MAG: MraY family glycosyltransferase, partial [Anaerolineales bacterium]|nr:MraY family glycosyltransferase [Anaerolineales bacterium]
MFAIALLVVVGVLDDHQDIPPLIKFGIQIVAAIILIADDTVVTAIGDVLNWQDGNLQGLGYLAKPLTIVAIVGLINAYNFIDGHDGLSASMLLLSLSAVVYVCGLSDEWKMQYFLLLYLFSVMVFLIFNLPLALVKTRQIFLGDAGSMMFGVILIYALIELAERPVPVLRAT